MDPERIDFSPLDPTRHRDRWERLILTTVSEGLRALAAARRVTVGEWLAGFRRWALPLAALLALLVVGAWLLWGASEPASLQAPREPDGMLHQWAGGSAPTPWDLYDGPANPTLAP